MDTNSPLEPTLQLNLYIAGSGNYIGCFRDESDRAMDGYSQTANDMTVEKCMELCADEVMTINDDRSN